jgi:uncharacterized protein (TIGR03084 family)
MAIFDDLVAEQDRLDGILSGLDEQQWLTPSAADGWSVADVVLHLAQGDESVAATAEGRSIGTRPDPGMTVDEVMAYLVQSERAAPADVFSRWRRARTAASAALRAADPQAPLAWVGAPVKPPTLATTRLAEVWAHGLDITAGLGLDLPDTDRLRHIAWLAHRTLPYAFAVAGGEPRDIYCDLLAPDGSAWQFGSPEAGSAISGPAGAFCRVAAQRLAPDQSGLQARGPDGEMALRLIRTYAA